MCEVNLGEWELYFDKLEGTLFQFPCIFWYTQLLELVVCLLIADDEEEAQDRERA